MTMKEGFNIIVIFNIFTVTSEDDRLVYLVTKFDQSFDG